jgi:hypothetical protein
MSTWPRQEGEAGPHYIPWLCVTEEYITLIRRLHVTKEYSFIFLGTEEYKAAYSSTLYSSIHSLVNRGI